MMRAWILIILPMSYSEVALKERYSRSHRQLLQPICFMTWDYRYKFESLFSLFFLDCAIYFNYHAWLIYINYIFNTVHIALLGCMPHLVPKDPRSYGILMRLCLLNLCDSSFICSKENQSCYEHVNVITCN